MKGLFVTGTDTEIGKSWISVALMAALQARGISVAGMKPVASGCEQTAAGLRNEDALMLQRQASIALEYAAVNPYAFVPPIAPHIAAERAGVEINLGSVRSAYESLAAQVDTVVVEGVGGWYVPLDAEHTVADLAVALGLPVVLVVGMRLGCINHALLTVEAIERAGLPLAGWVANRAQREMAEFEANLAALKARIAPPLLGVVPHLTEPTAAAGHLDMDLLLK